MIGIVSDLHLGNPQSYMCYRDRKTGKIRAGELYDAFRQTIKDKYAGKPLDYLVLLGDILDFSVVSYQEVYEVGRFFFQIIRDDHLMKEIIYVPGNHDFDIWSTVQYQLHITNRITRHKSPKAFRMSVPGVLDYREKHKKSHFLLPFVRRHPLEEESMYAGLFLDDLTDPPTPFNFAFPNLYLLLDDQSILITHGQYLDVYWSLLSRWWPVFVQGELGMSNGPNLNLEDLVSINFPFSLFENSAVGQAGIMTKFIQKVVQDVNENGYESLEKYIKRLRNELRNEWGGLRKIWNNLLFSFFSTWLINRLKTYPIARYHPDFLNLPATRKRFDHFYEATAVEIDELRENKIVEMDYPSRMIYGHTHLPLGLRSPREFSVLIETPAVREKLIINNTGGWLPKYCRGEDYLSFPGSEIFFFDAEQGLSSESIGYDPKDVGCL